MSTDKKLNTVLVVLVLWCLPLDSALADRPNARGLLAFEVERVAGPEAIAELRAEPEGAVFLSALQSDRAWMKELLESGPVRKGDRVLEVLFELWKSDPGLVDRPVDRSMATACALAVGMNDRGDDSWMADKYAYFRDQYEAGLLNACYEDLSTWDRRFLARGAQYAAWTSPEALAYLRERICWPRQKYVKACWQAPYRGNNCFGDSVQGWKYYHPFNDWFRCEPEKAIEVGGVCGALSNTGAAAAIANGIPALTMGEPGHCAYAVQTEPGVWTPAYSLSWKRSLHTSHHRATWASLMMLQAAQLQPARFSRAAGSRRLGYWYEDHDQPIRAERAYRSACSVAPLNVGNWQALAEFGRNNNASRAWWKKTHDSLVASLLPEHPEPAWHLLRQEIYPSLFEEMPPNERQRYLQVYLNRLSDWGTVRWNIESVFSFMAQQIPEGQPRELFIRSMLRTFIDSAQLGPVQVAWAQTALKDDPEGLRRFDGELLRRTNESSEGGDAVLKSMAKQTVPTAAASHDLDTFQRIGRAVSRLEPARGTLADAGIEAFPGALLSSGGALTIFKPGNRWDRPHGHWGVLNEQGGWFHTENGETPWFEVELPHFGNLSGIVLESVPGQLHRAKGVRILVSDDGEDWRPVGSLETASQWYRVDLSETRPQGRFVRFERDGKCLHFFRVLIYGERAS